MRNTQSRVRIYAIVVAPSGFNALVRYFCRADARKGRAKQQANKIGSNQMIGKQIVRQPPLTNPIDVLLADVAIRVQLNRTDYDKLVDRYQTINRWIEREGSPLKDSVELFYPQGSMPIDATIASKLRTDEFDIDVVAQLNLPETVTSSGGLGCSV